MIIWFNISSQAEIYYTVRAGGRYRGKIFIAVVAVA